MSKPFKPARDRGRRKPRVPPVVDKPVNDHRLLPATPDFWAKARAVEAKIRRMRPEQTSFVDRSQPPERDEEISGMRGLHQTQQLEGACDRVETVNVDRLRDVTREFQAFMKAHGKSTKRARLTGWLNRKPLNKQTVCVKADTMLDQLMTMDLHTPEDWREADSLERLIRSSLTFRND